MKTCSEKLGTSTSVVDDKTSVETPKIAANDNEDKRPVSSECVSVQNWESLSVEKYRLKIHTIVGRLMMEKKLFKRFKRY